MKQSLIITVLAFTLSACVQFQVGHNFDLQQVKSTIQHGVTTKAQINTLLGRPDSIGIVVDSDGNEFTRWNYYYGRGRLTSVHSTTIKTLEIQFDRNDIVRAYNWSGEAP